MPNPRPSTQPDGPPGFEVHPDLIKQLAGLYERRRQMAEHHLDRYYNNPAAFARDCIDWGDDQLAAYQYEALEALQERHRVCLRSLRGAGKTATEATAVLWFAVTRNALAVDWKCLTTAGSWNQLEQYLWPEIHKWARKLRWTRLSRDPFDGDELQKLALKLRTGHAYAMGSANPAFGEGLHADSVLAVLDEAKSIPLLSWDASEGAFSGDEAKTEVFVLAASTPGEPVGRFYDIQTRKPGYEDWHPMHVSLEMALAARRVSKTWVEQRGRQWGKDSAAYANYVLGEFHSSDEDAVIPLGWVEAAVERHKDSTLRFASRAVLKRIQPVTAAKRPAGRPALSCVSVDVARQGDDQTAIALIYGQRVEEVRHSFHEDTTMTTGRVAGIVGADQGTVRIVVDTDGLGAGVTDQLREQDYEVLSFHGGYATDRKDRSGELGFVGWRSAAWWYLREILDPHPCACPGPAYCPEHGSTVELPDDPLLTGDLTAPRMKRITSKSKIEIEQKVDTKQRLGRSPDSGDAVVMGFWPGERAHRRRRMVSAGRLGSVVARG